MPERLPAFRAWPRARRQPDPRELYWDRRYRPPSARLPERPFAAVRPGRPALYSWRGRLHPPVTANRPPGPGRTRRGTARLPASFCDDAAVVREVYRSFPAAVPTRPIEHEDPCLRWVRCLPDQARYSLERRSLPWPRQAGNGNPWRASSESTRTAPAAGRG